jgi:tetratricopeptide (TPR) repeat protein
VSRRWRAAAALAGVGLLAGACGKSPRQHLDAGNAYAAEGKLPEAVIEYRSALKADPSLAEAEVELADALDKVGNKPAALAAMERAANLLPRDADVQTRAGSMLLLAGRVEEAKARAEKALAVQPTRVDALVLRANALAGMSDLDGALAEIERALALEPSAGVLTNVGTLRLARKEPQQAEDAFRQAIAAAPDAATPHLALANFHWASGRFDAAEAEFQAALKAEPTHAQALRSTAVFYLATSRPARAEPYLRRRAEASTTPGPSLELAAYLRAIGRRDDAKGILTNVAGMPGAWGTATTSLGWLAQESGDAAGALALADQVIAREPGSVDAHVLKARALASNAKWDEALAAASRALELNPKSEAALYVQGRIHASRGALADAARAFERVIAANPKAVPAQIALARVELARGQPAAAATVAAAAAASGGGVAARLALAEAYATEGRLTEADQELNLAIAAAPNLSMAYVQRGRVRQAMRKPDAAREAFARAVSLEPASATALSGLALLDLQAGKGREALGRAQAAVDKWPKDAGLWLLLARVAGSTGDAALAEKALRRALAEDPDTLDAYDVLARLYLRRGDTDRAAKELEEMVSRDPRALGPRIMLGVIAQVQGRNPQAEAHYTAALGVNPRAAVAANNLAGLLAARGELDRALELAKAAKADLPDRAEVSDTLADVYMRKSLPQLAAQQWRDAVDRDPQPAYRYRLARAYRALGRDADARTEIEKALAGKAAFADRAAAERELAELRKTP